MKRRMEQESTGHITAVITIFIWGTTFVSTKLLLQDFSPVEILIFRFILGYSALWLAKPQRIAKWHWQEEKYFLAAGLLGITLYYLSENIALVYTSAANIGVIVSLAPFFTALLTKLIVKDTQISGYFYIGFVVALAGIVLISFNGAASLDIHPIGDFLGLVAALIWAFYSLLSKKIAEFGYSTIVATRKIFFYGILGMIPVVFVSDVSFSLERITAGTNLFHFLFLGFSASAMCFATWNYSVKMLGATRTSVYIYAIPVITVVTSALFLHEAMTGSVMLGTALTTVGLFLSEKQGSLSKKRENRQESVIDSGE